MRRRFGRFGAVGLAGAAVQASAFAALARWTDWPAAAAAAMAVELAVLHNFCWHERVTWRDRERGGWRGRARRLWRFHWANAAVSVAGNAAIVWLLAERCGTGAWAAQAAAIAICAPANYLAADRWVFAAGPWATCGFVSESQSADRR